MILNAIVVVQDNISGAWWGFGFGVAVAAVAVTLLTAGVRRFRERLHAAPTA